MAYGKTWGNRSYSRNVRVTLPSNVEPPTFTPSPYQQAIKDWLATGTGSAIIDATAGSGKTSTLKLLAFALPTNARAIFLAFNKSIATELSTKLPSTCPAMTFHALGFKALRPVANLRQKDAVSAYKCGDIFDALYPNDNNPIHGKARAVVLRLVSLAKGSALPPSDLTDEWADDTIAYFDLDDNNVDIVTLANMARDVLKASNADLTCVDFDDMLYLPILLGARFDTYDYVMVDESQDTNAVQRAILHKLVGNRGRLIAVGDAAQAIYGFRGADSDALDLIASEFECTRYPLSISYRCPRAIVEAASTYSDNIEAAPNAKDGQILYPEKWTVTQFAPNDLLMCRNTAPIIGAAYKCLISRMPVQVLGREIGNGLKALIKKLSTRATTLDTLPGRIGEWAAKETEAATQKKQEWRVQAVNDKADAILMLIDSMTDDDRTRGIDGLLSIIDSLFADKDRAVRMATIHKAKGLEAHRTFILDAHLMPSKYARQPHQLRQEANLTFVAITRSLDTLIYISSDMLARD